MISASLSLSLPRLGWKSTSTPRSLKICTAAGESASEMRTRGAMDVGALGRLGQRVPGLGVGPVEPRDQRLDVGGFDGGAAPDAKPGRRVAMAGDVVGD